MTDPHVIRLRVVFNLSFAGTVPTPSGRFCYLHSRNHEPATDPQLTNMLLRKGYANPGNLYPFDMDGDIHSVEN